MKRAYTLLEILLVIALLSVVASLTFPFALSQISDTSVQVAVEDVQSQLFATQVAGFAGDNGNSHGIAFFTDNYTVFEGDSLATATSTTNFEYDNNAQALINLDNGGNEIVISKHSIIPSTFGTITFTNNSSTFTLEINEEGLTTIQN